MECLEMRFARLTVAAGLLLLCGASSASDVQNLIANGDFECGTPDQGWYVPAPWKIVEGAGRKGGRALVWENEDEGKYSFPYSKVPLEPGAVYRFGAWVKVSALKGKQPKVAVDWDDDQGNWLCSCKAQPVMNNEVGTDGWQWYEGVTKPIPGNVGKNTRVLCFINRGGVGRIAFDGFMLRQEGSKMVGSIITSAYHDETSRDAGPVRFVASLNVNTVKYRMADLCITLDYLGSDGTRHVAPAKRASPRMAEFEVDSSAFSIGEQRMELKISLADKVVGAETLRFCCSEAPVDRRVRFDRQGRVSVGGKRIFPLGMYTYSMTDEQLAVYSKGPFNMVIQYGRLTTNDLDRYYAKGIYTITDVRRYINGYSWGTKCQVSSVEDSQAKFRELVKTFGAHPGLLAWYLVDEAPYSFHADIIAANRYLNSIDPHHPTYALTDKPGDISSLLTGFDVIGVDPYPVANPHQAGEDFSVCSKWVEQTQANVYGMRPMWTVPQAFNWEWYEKGMRKAEMNYRMPSRAEMANMNWQSIAAGSNGLGLYAFHALVRNLRGAEFEKAWGDVCSAAGEIRREEGVLLSEPMELNCEIPRNVAVRAWKSDRTVWLLVVNRNAAPAEGAIPLPGIYSGSSFLEGKGASLGEDGKTVSYSFEALGYVLMALKEKDI